MLDVLYLVGNASMVVDDVVGVKHAWILAVIAWSSLSRAGPIETQLVLVYHIVQRVHQLETSSLAELEQLGGHEFTKHMALFLIVIGFIATVVVIVFEINTFH